MNLSTWMAFVIAAVLISLSPGSGAVLSMSHGLAYGVKKTSVTVFGLVLGMLLVFTIAGAGVGTLLLASDAGFLMFKSVGAAYLVYLGQAQWRSTVDAFSVTIKGPDTAPSFGSRLLTGFLTNATNPKGIIFMVAVLPGFIDKSRSLMIQLFILGLTMATIDIIVMHGYAYLASTIKRNFHSLRVGAVLNRFFGGVLMAIGALLFFVKNHTP